MKALSVLIMVLAVLIAVVPQVYNCFHDGKTIALANGQRLPMKCLWTAIAEAAVAVPLLALGGLQAWNRTRETRRSLGILGGILGAFVILLPTVLIGVCAHPEASCNLVMRPALILMGTLVIALSVATALMPGKPAEQAA